MAMGMDTIRDALGPVSSNASTGLNHRTSRGFRKSVAALAYAQPTAPVPLSRCRAHVCVCNPLTSTMYVLKERITGCSLHRPSGHVLLAVSLRGAPELQTFRPNGMIRRCRTCCLGCCFSACNNHVCAKFDASIIYLVNSRLVRC